MGAVVVYTQQQTLEALERDRVAQLIQTDIFKLNTLTSDYNKFPNERVQKQWIIAHASLGNKLETDVLKEENKEMFIRIKEDHENLKTVFQRIITSNSSDIRTRQIVQMQVLSQQMISRIAHISQSSRNRIYFTQQVQVILVAALIGLFFVTNIVNSHYLLQTIGRPIEDLHEGADIIRGGDLSHRIKIQTNDEIQDLADSFNRMVADIERSQRELESYSKDLESKVRERTILLEEKVHESDRQRLATLNLLQDVNEVKRQLESVNGLLESANRELENYTYVVSHDLKEPLRSITSFSQFVLEDYGDQLDETGKDYLERVVKATNRMASLIEDLLKLSRIGRKNTEFIEVALNEVLDELKTDMTNLIESKNAKITYTKMPTIICQKTWISEVFKNLISNGIKYNKSKQPKVEIGLEEDVGQWVFSVSDNGIGIEEKYYNRIMQLFERLHTSEEYEGTGAGLAIVKSIIKHHKGALWVARSGVGKGTTFKFSISKSLIED
jgi:signal transduction histidine kinase